MLTKPPEEAIHLDKDLRPVLVLLICGHEEVASQDRHQAVPLGLVVDGGVPPQKAAKSLQERRQHTSPG